MLIWIDPRDLEISWNNNLKQGRQIKILTNQLEMSIHKSILPCLVAKKSSLNLLQRKKREEVVLTEEVQGLPTIHKKDQLKSQSPFFMIYLLETEP